MLNLSAINNQTRDTEEITSLNLSKGMSLDLTKCSNLKKVRFGLGWKAGNAINFDLDASAVLLNSKGIVNDYQDVVFYNQPNTNRGVWSLGDNRVGSNGSIQDDDDETIMVELDSVPSNIDTILFLVTIHEANKRKQNFGMVKDAYIRVVDEDTQVEQCRYNITESFSMQTSCEIAKLKRTNKGWEFIAVGEGKYEELGQILYRYGIR